jgi:hypothetical protein
MSRMAMLITGFLKSRFDRDHWSEGGPDLWALMHLCGDLYHPI